MQEALRDASREELRGSQGSGRGGVAGGRMEKLQAACGGAAESKDGGRLRDAKKRTSGGKKKKKKEITTTTVRSAKGRGR